MRIAAIVSGFFCFFFSISAMAVTVSGKVEVTPQLLEKLAAADNVDPNAANRPYYWNVPNGILPVIPPRIDLSSDIAIIVSKDDKEANASDPLRTVKVYAGSMETDVIITRPGSTIRFRNVDPFDHELYSPQLQGFQPERQSNGSFRPMEFQQEGVFEIRCKLIPHFKSYLVVTKALRAAQANKDGTFALENMTPGKYTVKVFYDGAWIYEEPFVIGGQQREAKLEIKLKPGGADADKAKGKEGEKAAKAE